MQKASVGVTPAEMMPGILKNAIRDWEMYKKFFVVHYWENSDNSSHVEYLYW